MGQTRLHCVTPGNFVCLCAAVLVSVKWVGANKNCLMGGLKVVIHRGLIPLQEPDSEALSIFQSSGKFVSLTFPVPALLLFSSSFKS